MDITEVNDFRELTGVQLDCPVAVCTTESRPMIQVGNIPDSPKEGRQIGVWVLAPGQMALMALMTAEEALGMAEALVDAVMRQQSGTAGMVIQ